MEAQTRAAVIEAVKAHATAHYEQGWDVVVECYSAEEIAEELPEGCTIAEALAIFGEICGLRQEAVDNVMSQSGEHVKGDDGGWRLRDAGIDLDQ